METITVLYLEEFVSACVGTHEPSSIPAQLFRNISNTGQIRFLRYTQHRQISICITNSISNFKGMDYEENNMSEIMHYEENRWKTPWFWRIMSLNIIQTWVILDALKHLVETPSSEDFFFFRWDLLRPKNQVLEPWRFKRTPGQSGILVRGG